MSVERDLLKTIYSYVSSGYWVIDEFETQIEDTVKEIEKLLAQPEPEPVAWLITATSCGGAQDWKFVSLVRKAPERLERMFPKFTPLYTSPPSMDEDPVAWMYEFAVRSSFDASFTGEWKEEISRTKPDGVVKGFNPTKLESTVRNLVTLYTSPPTRDEDPVAWLSLSDIQWMNIVNDPEILKLTGGRHNFEDAVNLAVKMTEAKCKANNSNSIPAREPLSELEIQRLYENAEYLGFLAYKKGIKDAEKAHGIGAEQ